MKKDQNRNIRIESSMAECRVQVEAPAPPPPPGFTSPFKTIQEWLVHLCETNDPISPISEYHFLLIKSFSQNLLTLEGFNVYDLGDNTISYRIDFKPATNRYFALPNEKFGNLSPQQLNEQVLNELMDFIHSTRFQSSFLSKGGSIRMGLRGEIWSS